VKPSIRNLERLSVADDPTPYNGVGKGVRVVIADDERDTVMTLGILLRSEGFEVHLAGSGAEVGRVVAATRPHAVLLDIGMPDRSGHDVARELQGTYGARCPVLIAVTGRVSDADRKQAELSGFKHYFPKPYDPGELLNLLASMGTTSVAGLRDAQ
jgi:CheY-like chemotaxis protein